MEGLLRRASHPIRSILPIGRHPDLDKSSTSKLSTFNPDLRIDQHKIPTMPPRIPLPRLRHCPQSPRTLRPHLNHRDASTAAVTPAPSVEQSTFSIAPVARYPPTQPPSHKPPEFRKSQLHRQYASLLRTTPLMLLFQHNNLRASEWVGVRRELALALAKVDDGQAAMAAPFADGIKLQIIQTGIFAAALRVVEYFRPASGRASAPHPSDPSTQSSAALPNTSARPSDPVFTHGLSRAAHDAVVNKKLAHALAPLLSGPLALLTFPAVSPAHLKAALSVLAPSPPLFPPPRRSTNPGYHEPAVQSGLQKLLLLGARVEGKVFDVEGAKWVGSTDGGLDGLRARLVGMLQSLSGGLVGTLESAGKSLYFTVESRRGMLEDEQKGEEQSKEI